MEFVEGEPLTDILAAQPARCPPSAPPRSCGRRGEALVGGARHGDRPPRPQAGQHHDREERATARDLVKVVDFGIAKAASIEAQKVTRTGLVVGTPEYMSPEQIAGDPLDGRSDIYSLGLVAFNMLTGTLPFPSKTAQESMIMRLTEPPRRLAEIRPEIPWSPDVQAVMDRALQRDAALRYAVGERVRSRAERRGARAADVVPPRRRRRARGRARRSVPPTRVVGAGATTAHAGRAAPRPTHRAAALAAHGERGRDRLVLLVDRRAVRVQSAGRARRTDRARRRAGATRRRPRPTVGTPQRIEWRVGEPPIRRSPRRRAPVGRRPRERRPSRDAVQFGTFQERRRDACDDPIVSGDGDGRVGADPGVARAVARTTRRRCRRGAKRRLCCHRRTARRWWRSGSCRCGRTR